MEEIERKWLVKSLPEDLSSQKSEEINQGYLAVGKEEVRLRQKGSRYFINYKKGTGLTRIELPTHEGDGEIPRLLYLGLWPGTEGKRVEKTRYYLPYGRHIIELNLFHGKEEGKALIEVEFTSVEEANSFDPPLWFGKDVTDDDRYSNQSLAKNGFPEEASIPA